MSLAGRCLCGQVRFTVDESPLAVRSCWCRDCQYFACGSATVNVFFHTANLALDGNLTLFESDADSGNHMVRGFCPKCGTQVTTAALASPDLIGLRLGTLDDAAAFAPQAVIWTDSAPEWAMLDPALPMSPGQPAPLG